MRTRCYELDVEQRRSRSVPSTKADKDPRFLGKVTGDFPVSLVFASTVTFALNFVKRPAERREKNDRKWACNGVQHEEETEYVRRKKSNLSSRQFLKIAKGLGENETRLCKCLKNV